MYSIQGITNTNAVTVIHTNECNDSFTETYTIEPHIIGNIYMCNINDHTSKETNKYLMMCINIVWTKYICEYILCSIQLYFTPFESFDINKLCESKDTIKGTFIIEMKINNMAITLDIIDMFTDISRIKNTLISFSKSKDIADLYHDNIKKEEESRILMYKNDFDYFLEIPKPTIILKTAKLSDYDTHNCKTESAQYNIDM